MSLIRHRPERGTKPPEVGNAIPAKLVPSVTVGTVRLSSVSNAGRKDGLRLAVWVAPRLLPNAFFNQSKDIVFPSL